MKQSFGYHFENIFTLEVWLFIPSIFIILFTAWYIGLFDKKKIKETHKGVKEKATKPKKNSKKNTVKKKEFDSQYYKIEKILLARVVKEEYLMIKDFAKKLKNEEELKEAINTKYKNISQDKIIRSQANFKTISDVFERFINDYEKKNIKFNGLEEVLKYYSLSNKIDGILNTVILLKIMKNRPKP
tara:strand:- start:38 stop:595 length:558 start_codon:yes stop_codon:yes gene_type:complete